MAALRPRIDLLAQIAEQALEPEYRTTRRPSRRTANHHLLLAVTLVLVGVLLGSAAASTARTRPERANERAQLIGYVQAGEKSNDELKQQLIELRAEITDLQKEGLGSGEDADALRAKLAQLELAAGTTTVTGPGMIITVDDADDSGSSSGRLLDVDLRQAVNGLWLAGAEAVAINGHRITSLAAIRGAGDAITVDYRSLVRPYVISAIGDPATFPARWATSSGASWLNYLKQNYHVRYDAVESDLVTLPAGSPALRHATTRKSK